MPRKITSGTVQRPSPDETSRYDCMIGLHGQVRIGRLATRAVIDT